MPHLDFREALSTPEEQSYSSGTAVAMPGAALVAASIAQQTGFISPVRLSRSAWTNIVFVAIASIGGIVCGFYFFNGIELLRAAASWPAEFLYPRPAIIVAANVDPLQPQLAPDEAAAASGKAAAGSQSKDPFAGDFWQSDLTQTPPAAPFGSAGTISAPPFSGPGGFFGGLNLLPSGADAIFQSFYQRATATIKTVTRTVRSSVTSTRKRISTLQQKTVAQSTTATASASSTARSSTQTAQQTAAQTRADLSTIHAQNQMMMGVGSGGIGGGVGGGVGAGGLGGAIGGVSGMVGGVGGKH